MPFPRQPHDAPTEQSSQQPAPTPAVAQTTTEKKVPFKTPPRHMLPRSKQGQPQPALQGLPASTPTTPAGFQGSHQPTQQISQGGVQGLPSTPVTGFHELSQYAPQQTPQPALQGFPPSTPTPAGFQGSRQPTQQISQVGVQGFPPSRPTPQHIPQPAPQGFPPYAPTTSAGFEGASQYTQQTSQNGPQEYFQRFRQSTPQKIPFTLQHVSQPTPQQTSQCDVQGFPPSIPAMPAGFQGSLQPTQQIYQGGVQGFPSSTPVTGFQELSQYTHQHVFQPAPQGFPPSTPATTTGFQGLPRPTPTRPARFEGSSQSSPQQTSQRSIQEFPPSTPTPSAGFQRVHQSTPHHMYPTPQHMYPTPQHMSPTARQMPPNPQQMPQPALQEISGPSPQAGSQPSLQAGPQSSPRPNPQADPQAGPQGPHESTPRPTQQAPLSNQATVDWMSLQNIRKALVPRLKLQETIYDPAAMCGLSYQDLALEAYLDSGATEPPICLLEDMMLMVGPMPTAETPKYYRWLLNKYSYWIPFTKFVAEGNIKNKEELHKLVTVVEMLSKNSMLDPVFVHRCFAYAINWYNKIGRTAKAVHRLRKVLHSLVLKQLAAKGQPITRPSQVANSQGTNSQGTNLQDPSLQDTSLQSTNPQGMNPHGGYGVSPAAGSSPQQ